MCKFCNLTNGVADEQYTTHGPILKVTDGSIVSEVLLNRYIRANSGIRYVELTNELCVNIPNVGSMTLKNKSIKIKYCPFCGKKL